jgi:hypothetical protein
MKYVIKYSGGPAYCVWHGTVIVEAEDAAQAIHKIENDIACIPASIYAVNPQEQPPSYKDIYHPYTGE